MKRRLITSFLITVALLFILLIPAIEFINWGFIENISMLIHWPLFAIGFFGETDGGIIFFAFFWYGAIVGIGTYLIYLILQIIENK